MSLIDNAETFGYFLLFLLLPFGTYTNKTRENTKRAYRLNKHKQQIDCLVFRSLFYKIYICRIKTFARTPELWFLIKEKIAFR